MKTIKKVNILIAILAMFLITACNTEVVVRDPSPVVPTGNQTVYFSSKNATSYELDPAAPTSVTVTLQRKDSTSAADVPLKVLKNDSNIFVIPATASFQAGKGSTTISVGFPQSVIGTSYAFEIAVSGDNYLNPYSSVVPVVRVSIVRVKWDLVGSGQFYDSFVFASAAPVQIFYSALKKQYRIPNPYTDAMLIEAGWNVAPNDYMGGPKDDYLVYQVAADGNITWTVWNTGLNYKKVAGQPIQAFFPLYLGTVRNVTTYNADPKSSVDPTNPKLLKLNARYYIIGLGGFGVFPIYISLPGGPDLKTLLGL
jgi:hypothetical protein